MGNTNPVTPLKTRLHIATGMSVQTVTTKGNTCQKAVANVFDFNGDGKYQENEAATFNSVRIRQHSKDNYTIWQKNNGKDKATHLTGDFSNLKFAPNRTKNTAPAKKSVKLSSTSNKTAATIAVEDFVKQGKGELKVATYPNGAIKSKDYKSKDRYTEIHQEYYDNGNPKSERVHYNYSNFSADGKRVEYYPNGKVKSSYERQDTKYSSPETFKEYYDNGNPKSERVHYNYSNFSADGKRVEYYPNGKVKSSYERQDTKYSSPETFKEYYDNGNPKLERVHYNYSDFNGDGKRVEYYPNGKIKSSYEREDTKYSSPQIFKEYYDNGNPKSHIVKEWDSHARLEKNYKGEYEWRGDYVEKTNIQYDKNGNVINTAKVNK